MYLEVIHLVPGHFLYDLLKIIQSKGLPCHVKDKSAHFIKRIIAGRTLRDRRIAALL